MIENICPTEIGAARRDRLAGGVGVGGPSLPLRVAESLLTDLRRWSPALLTSTSSCPSDEGKEVAASDTGATSDATMVGSSPDFGSVNDGEDSGHILNIGITLIE